LERDNSSLKLALPVVSPGLGTTKPPVLAWQPKFGVDKTRPVRPKRTASRSLSQLMALD
jgi:hypothetical protein